jgi:hypothetical protein
MIDFTGRSVAILIEWDERKRKENKEYHVGKPAGKGA